VASLTTGLVDRCDGPVFDAGHHGQYCTRASCRGVATLGSGLCGCRHSAIPEGQRSIGPFSIGDGGACLVATTIVCGGRPLTTVDEA
jgi:hypothetical protein